jgi:FlaG protein
MTTGGIERSRFERAGLHYSGLIRSDAARAGRREERRDPDRVSSAGQIASMHLSYDKDIGRIVAQILDGESGTVVRQLPSEETVAFLKRFREVVPLVDKTV